MTRPLIIQIQEAVLDSNSSLSEALRKAKVACAKLGLTEFEQWIDKELGGYGNVPVASVPEYRKLYGTPEALNNFRGWLPIQFRSATEEEKYSFAPVGMSVPEIERPITNASQGRPGYFVYEYSPEIKSITRSMMNYADDLRLRLDISKVFGILEAVRNILLNWTIDMEKQGIIGDGLMFTNDDKEKSAEVTARTVNTFNIQQVGALVQSANQSVVQGEVTTTKSIVTSTQEIVPQLRSLLAASNLPPAIASDAGKAIDELGEAANAPNPDGGRIQRAWGTIKRVLAPAGETVLRLAVDAAVSSLFHKSGA